MPSRPLRVALPVVAMLLLVPVGCGQESAGKPNAAATKKPDPGAEDCRSQWADLGKSVEGNEEKTEPSAMAERWNAVVATIDYYAAAATKADCEDRLDAQKSAITALTAFQGRLRPYDVEYRFAQVRSDAEKYAAGPQPSAPKPRKKGAKPPAAPPAPKDVGAAMKTVTDQAATAAKDQAPGWQQADVAELTDKAAVDKAVKDLAFLSTESKAYAACAQALATIKKALAAGK